MRIIRNLLLFIPLSFFLACQGPYHKDEKKPIKIGIQEIASVDEAEGDADGDKESIIDLPSLDNKGVGPIDNVDLDDEIDQAMAAAGEETFGMFCAACHKMNQRTVGPALGNVTELRSPEWIMNMILDPDTMLQEDPVAIALLEEFIAPMANMGLSEDETREVLEYLRTQAL